MRGMGIGMLVCALPLSCAATGGNIREPATEPRYTEEPSFANEGQTGPDWADAVPAQRRLQTGATVTATPYGKPPIALELAPGWGEPEEAWQGIPEEGEPKR